MRNSTRNAMQYTSRTRVGARSLRPEDSSLLLPIVGVFGSGTFSVPQALEVGAWLAREGVHLLTGGGRGVMADVSRAFHEVEERRGLVIGIIPSRTAATDAKPGYPNPWVEVPIFTHLPLSGDDGADVLSRNHINVLSSNVIIALKGGPGTLSEVKLALKYGRPVAAYVTSADDIPGLPDEVAVLRTLEEVGDFVRRHLLDRS